MLDEFIIQYIQALNVDARGFSNFLVGFESQLGLVAVQLSMNTKDIVSRYFENLHTQDWGALRALMHDDLRFEGPIDQFDKADDLVKALGKLAKIAKGAEVKRFFVEGDDACVIYDLHTDTPIGTSQVAEWFQLRDGRIGAIRVHFDARPFAAMFAQQGAAE